MIPKHLSILRISIHSSIHLPAHLPTYPRTYQVQQQIPVIPKAQHLAYQKENLDLFGWELSQEDVDALSHATSPAVSGGANGTSGDCTVA